MTNASPQTILLSDYTPFGYLIDSVHLTFDLDPNATRVTSRIAFRPDPACPNAPFFLHGENLALIWAKIDGVAITPTLSDTGLRAEVPNAPFVWEAAVEIAPAANTALEGLYQSNGMYCTQCEAEGFRKITYYPDRPDVMAIFTVRVNGPHPVLLSNGNPTASGEGWAEWHDPWPKPAYLFALVAGALIPHTDRFTTASGRDVTLNLYVRAGDEHKCAFGMDALKRSMAWDETTYGREYDLDVFNIVAVDDFNMGAMENKGLNIFNSSAVLASPDTSTDANFERIEAIIAHEYFHNWTGNRITCRDWFQLCLKEGLTVFRDSEFTSDMRSAPVKRISDVIQLRARQFREDNGPLAHPVRPDRFVEINNFYTATVYEKGAELVRMLKTLVGDAAYATALTEYFNRFDGMAVTIEDWLKVFEDTTGRDLSQFKRWYTDAGTPRLSVHETFADNTLALTFSQSTPPTPGQSDKPARVIPIAVGLLREDGTEILPTTILEMTEPSQSFSFPGHSTRPMASILRGFSAPVIMQRPLTDAQNAFLLAHDTDPFNKWEAGRALGRTVLTTIATGGAVDPAYLAALGNVARDTSLDPAFRALALRAPTQDEIAQTLFDAGQTPDPAKIFTASEDLATALAHHLADDLPNLYQTHSVPGPFSPDAAAAGHRDYQSVILSLLSRLDGGASARAQFATADNMTQSFTALSVLMARGIGADQSAEFYDKWRHDRLVMDKWFALQIGYATPEMAAQTAAQLAQHPDFNLKNPNRFRATFGALAMHHAGFHHASGAGYNTLADWLIKLDALNPQTTARMSTSFETWKRYAPALQTHAKSALTRILNTPDLSRDTTEMITRILG